jgi:hypothetical protein
MRTALLWLPLALLVIGGCSSSLPPEASKPTLTAPVAPVAFTPGVKGRSVDQFCNSASPACQKWTELARKCEYNLRQREAGYMGRQEPYCTDAEIYREQVTGIELENVPGAYNF